MKKESGTGAVSVRRSRRAWVIAALLVAMSPFVFGGCYGSFPLTHKIYDFNDDISHDETIKSVTFWAFVIIPVYEVGMLADAIIFNLVEFWTGEQHLAAATMDSNGHVVSLTPSSDGQEVVLTVSRDDGRVIAQESFVKVSDTTFEVRDAQGALHGKVLKAPDGTISLTDRNGTVLSTLPAEALPAM